MTKSFEKRKEHLEKQLCAAREKLKRMKRGKREYRSGPAALLWRAFTSKPTLDHIRASWSEEQMQRMVERGRAEFHRRAKRCRGPPKSGQSATKLAGCFYRVFAAAGEAERDAGARILPEGVFASGVLRAAAERWLSDA
jgi:hypothetical protein